ncbi:MAG: 3-deoxy-D-manno-octulosonic acid transferase [Pirellulales bacterium]|nr:3-deoxy-D-manno-octulosonic acid transferase [Pirellulales bacterium]
MPYLLNLLYLGLLIVVSPWLVWQAMTKGKYRAGFGEKFLGRAPRRKSAGPCCWLHAVSVGEVNLLGRLIEEIRLVDPRIECVISTTTRTGMELARKKYADHTVFYCPLDFSWAVRAAMRRIRPNVLVLAELELWPNLIRAAGEAGASVAVVNGRLGEKSFRGYLRIRRLVASVMRRIDLVATQDDTYAERFQLLGARPEAVQVTGSMKYDGAQTDRANPATRRLAQLAGFDPEDVVFLAGSTQEPEEQMALDVYRRLAPRWPRLRLVLVPRHPERFGAVARLLDASGVPWQRRTTLDEHSASADARVLLVDVVGELGAWWGTSKIAFVGGSFGNRGGQNMIEPAAYGSAVSFGPNTWNFRDIVTTLLAHDAAVALPDVPALEAFVRRCLEEPDWADALGQRAATLVADQLGATARTAGLLTALLNRPDSDRAAA